MFHYGGSRRRVEFYVGVNGLVDELEFHFMSTVNTFNLVVFE